MVRIEIIQERNLKSSNLKSDIIIIIGNISNNILVFSYHLTKYLRNNPNAYILLVPKNPSLIQTGYKHERYYCLNDTTIKLHNITIHGSSIYKKTDADINISYTSSSDKLGEFEFDSDSPSSIIDFG